MSQKPLTLKDLGMTQEELDQAIEEANQFLIKFNTCARRLGLIMVDSTAVVLDDVNALPEAKHGKGE